MKITKLTIFLIAIFVFNLLQVRAEFPVQYQPQYQAQVTFVPAGTPVTVTMNDTLGSEFTQVGERFTATLAGPIYSGRDLIAQPGSLVDGTVVEVNPAGRAGKPASMNLRINNLTTTDGRRIPLSASIDQEIFKLKAEGGVTSNLVKSSVVGAGAGALSGLVGAAISGGKKGKATAIGTAIGTGSGLLVGACMIQRPELFAAALPAVGVMDMLRFHKFTIGWAWMSDYGSPDDPNDFAYIYKYSPLHNLRQGIAYPATLVITADTDDRVVPAHSFKFAAALQKAHAGEQPVLIRIETKAGHGGGKPTTKIIEEVTDQFAFLCRVLAIAPSIKLNSQP